MAIAFSACVTLKYIKLYGLFHNEAEREAVNAAERAERKQHLREKVSFCFGPCHLLNLWKVY